MILPILPMRYVFHVSRCILYLLVQGGYLNFTISFFLVWMEKAEQIRCPAPLPEELVIPCLAKMLVPAPYTVLEKKATGKAKGVRSGPCCKGALDVTSEPFLHRRRRRGGGGRKQLSP